MPPRSSSPQTFYRFVDEKGRLHVVSSLDALPRDQRAGAERVELAPESALGRVPAATTERAWQLEPGSFGLGFGAALLLSLLFRLLPGGWRSVTRVAVVLGISALLTGLYLGSIRRATGQAGGSALASPSALIEDAKSAVEKLNQRQKQQDEELRKLQAEGR